MTFQARIASPAKRPSTCGLDNAPRITPSNDPAPSTGIDAVGDATMVMMPVSRRWLSCQLLLVMWKGSREASPQAVRPSKATKVSAVAKLLGAKRISAPSKL